MLFVLYQRLLDTITSAGLHDVKADLLPRWQKVSSVSLVKLSPDALASQIGRQLLPCSPPFGIVTVLILSPIITSWHPTGATLAQGRSGTMLCNPAQNHVPRFA